MIFTAKETLEQLPTVDGKSSHATKCYACPLSYSFRDIQPQQITTRCSPRRLRVQSAVERGSLLWEARVGDEAEEHSRTEMTLSSD